ncbi:hypothetical protein SADUNF_Sadunf06G0089300 [Salix dunnii]|uniref:Uncharacterized protein n=1 Tax=Salix dunnii TaxID=1413687 RepID=A0A835K6A1_9ROSI|nr:hypothetical protein SADUNF_Sadunf06G0089300 [Salix dunnii]
MARSFHQQVTVSKIMIAMSKQSTQFVPTKLNVVNTLWLVQDVNFPRSSFHTEKSFSLNKHPDCLCKSDLQFEDFGLCSWVVVATAFHGQNTAPVAALVVLVEKTDVEKEREIDRRVTHGVASLRLCCR